MASEKLTRSARLRKFGESYDECLRKIATISSRSPTRSPRKIKSPIERGKKKELNAYQKFVSEESQKKKYKGVPSHERMTAISKEWNKQKISK
jgi:hypothetical protein